ncbi:MAG: adenosylcobinamide-GDP ribazoletransferase [Bacteroidales bacterium]|uniref:adenosylcobinamide-GDP ribazoletransferase n=1 Tax=Porphyromonas sp. TaxID=1924944 RepID=UPI00297B0B84|nr:adenosylcobinamide-GDP ribazoletransferase [Porphyromonas sp.]MDD7438240.1 adenosylcobinamide-GDP ribazoletransferase [Bacteroidales bacterium]MDY3067706.1 adenosylcobinamide-GDP ribazoletransferase [Porphyromonas sp.]
MGKAKRYLYDIIAALTALTRLPIWKIKEVPKEHYERVVYYWPIVGWLTGPLTAGVLLGMGQFTPVFVAVAFAFAFRILLTGGIHEDGLMDFFDGFGGGQTKERTLEIMKDSHTGAFAVIGFVSYAILWIGLLGFMPLKSAAMTVMIADPMSKFVASNLPRLLTYARTEAQAKMGVVYERKPHRGLFIMGAHFGLLPISQWSAMGWWLLLFSAVTFFILVWIMKRKIGGYTGDCCGATFLICEVISFTAIWIMV